MVIQISFNSRAMLKAGFVKSLNVPNKQPFFRARKKNVGTSYMEELVDDNAILDYNENMRKWIKYYVFFLKIFTSQPIISSINIINKNGYHPRETSSREAS